PRGGDREVARRFLVRHPAPRTHARELLHLLGRERRPHRDEVRVRDPSRRHVRTDGREPHAAPEARGAHDLQEVFSITNATIEATLAKRSGVSSSAPTTKPKRSSSDSQSCTTASDESPSVSSMPA